jgi:hypothetical protein
MPVYEGGAGVPTPAGVDMVAAWIAPPDDDEDDGAAEPEAAPPPKSRAKKAAG